MDGEKSQPLRRALMAILRPLTRLLLRNGMSYAEFAECARLAFVNSAMTDFAIQGRKPTVSRAAVVTGLTRKEVRRLLDQAESSDDPERQTHNRAARVVSGWIRDARFQTSEGEPARLPFDEDRGPTFFDLVKQYSGDMPARAVFDELHRVGVVAQEADGRISLLKRSYLPAGDGPQQLYVVGNDVSDLLKTINHNLAADGESPRFQRTLRYDNVPLERLDAWRKIAAKHSQALLEELDLILAPLDRDVGKSGNGGAGRARTGVSIFYFEEELSAPNERVHGND